MKLYIDKENLIAFLKQGKVKELQEVHEEVLRLIKRQLQVIYNFDKKELTTNPLIRVCLDELSRGLKANEDEEEFRTPPFPERPIKNNFRTNQPWELFTSAFLVNDEKIDALKKGKSILIGKVGEETDLLTMLFCTSSFDLHSLYNIQNKETFNGWETLEQDGHIMPCSDIVIADRYLFQQQDDVLEKNIYAILTMFAKGRQGQKTNIIFFTDPKYLDEPFRKNIKKKIDDIFGKQPGAKVTFVLYGNERPHDRFILTNYRLFRSGDSFNYFDNKGNLVSKGLTLDVDSLASSNVCSVVAKMQEDLQNLCNKASERIFGAKESNFIHFLK